MNALSDTIIRDGMEQAAEVIRPCGRLGSRTELRAKTACQNTAEYAPLYRCPIFRLCSPFALINDSELIQPCEGCPKFTSVQSGTAPSGAVKIENQ